MTAQLDMYMKIANVLSCNITQKIIQEKNTALKLNSNNREDYSAPYKMRTIGLPYR